MLDGDHVQGVRQDEPVADTVAEGVTGPRRTRRVAAPHRPQERLGLAAVVLDPAGPQLMVQLLVHTDLPSARCPLAWAGGTRTA